MIRIGFGAFIEELHRNTGGKILQIIPALISYYLYRSPCQVAICLVASIQAKLSLPGPPKLRQRPGTSSELQISSLKGSK